MKIRVSGKNVEVTPALEAHIEKGIVKVKKFFDGILDVEATLSVEKRNQRAEINIKADGVYLHGEARSADLYKSIDIAVSRIQVQLVKYKEKLKDHRLRRSENGVQKDLDVKVDVLHGEEVDYGEKDPSIIRSRDYSAKPMSVEEAAMQMDLVHQPVLVFINDESSKLNVLWKRQDGHYELIAPDV